MGSTGDNGADAGVEAEAGIDQHGIGAEESVRPATASLDYVNPLHVEPVDTGVASNVAAIVVGAFMSLPAGAMLADAPNGRPLVLELAVPLAFWVCSGLGMLIGGIAGVARHPAGPKLVFAFGSLVMFVMVSTSVAWAVLAHVMFGQEGIVCLFIGWICFAVMTLPAFAVATLAKLPAGVSWARLLLFALGVVTVIGGVLELADGFVGGVGDELLIGLIVATVATAAVGVVQAVRRPAFAVWFALVPWSTAVAATLRFATLREVDEFDGLLDPFVILTLVFGAATLGVWWKAIGGVRDA